MKWYLVKLVFQVLSGEGVHTPQFDEQVRLITADEVNWAYEKAKVIGWLEQRSFLNHRAESVTWKFIEIAEIHEVENPEDGVLLCSYTVEPGNAQEYIESITIKAEKSLAISLSKEQTSSVSM
ncbi:MAG: DUF4288 domain-containing protein [Flammeovirgaceae bacterium]|jgi:hypothetical protein|nr:DUF4288 domain-containing protein [Flammeovirgaceae bacterium]